ncbi:alkaline phosphatase family protein [Jatrophihabitans endophyticus]|uniref:alkaline phosphatase family protein n=1 Tax=Jatrophihabitans endophyticus TaxID=1206085 RepID=UPI0019DDDAE6|nr:nucleotide pyrophosphatase/phosphodiesterase family protein [Jatrophihabitans endophyticus]MBE7188427.1 alkaline phosphatase family protein [Jatrophihabitans endophyticus]
MSEPGPTLCDILPGVGALLGVPGAPDRFGLVAGIGPRRQVVVVLVDGLGLHLLPRLAPVAPFLAGVLAGSVGTLHPLKSTFPSTTPTSLVSLGTGTAPGEHGVLGFTVRRPGTAETLTHVLWRDDPEPARWQPVPTWFERLAAAGVPSAVVLPAAFEKGGLTSAAYRGATFVPHPTADRGPASSVPLVLEALDRGVPLVFAYTDLLDAAAHRYGIDSPEWLAAAARVDAYLRTLAGYVPPDGALLVTADHGGLDISAAGRVDLDANPVLADAVEVVAGEPRVRYLHTRPGADRDVAAAWSATLGERAVVRLRDDAIAEGWFGPVRPGHEARIGDVVVVCEGDTAILASAHEPPEVGELIGFHGGWSPAETGIPLIVVTPDG